MQEETAEAKALRYLNNGDVDLALITYRNIQPTTAKIQLSIGQLCSERKGDFHFALQSFQHALKIQEEVGSINCLAFVFLEQLFLDQNHEDTSETLTLLGNLYHRLNNYEQALSYHENALKSRESNSNSDLNGIATNLIGISQIYWNRQDFTRAIECCQRALDIREKIVPVNEISVAASLAMLANIQQDNGDLKSALDYATRAVNKFESNLPKNSPILADGLYSLGTIQFHSKLFDEAQRSFERSLAIYSRILPRGHQDRVAVEKDLKRLVDHRNKQQRDKTVHSEKTASIDQLTDKSTDNKSKFESQ